MKTLLFGLCPKPRLAYVSTDLQPEPETEGVLPDPAVCRAKVAGYTCYAYCLVEQPSACRYALSFGFAFFCRHPGQDEIVRRTAARAAKSRRCEN